MLLPPRPCLHPSLPSTLYPLLSQERILLDWFSERLQDGFSAVNPTALKLIESQVLAVLFSRGGLPCAAAVYAAYAEALWDRANEVVGVQRAMPPILVSFD